MKQGFILPLVAVIILIALLGAGAAYYVVNQKEQRTPLALPLASTAPATSVAPVQNLTTKSPAPVETAPVSFSGTVLAGTTTPLLDFNQADFALAQQSGKVIVLYFYANWCPICRAEFPLMQAAFNQLTAANVVGFRVNYNDTDTDDDEKSLAREHGIAYQHTKVIIKNGQQALKSPETWDTNRYVTEITAAAR